MKFLALIILTTFIVMSCRPMSESVIDTSVGFNGSFEVVEDGLPVNWIVYTPETVPNSDFEILFDTDKAKEGRQSLRFVVNQCDSLTGWKAPGLGQELDLKAGQKYKISFWIINQGSEFNIRGGGISEKESDMKTLIHTDIDYPNWFFVEYDYKMPPEFRRMRFELNIMKPGNFWIDDIRIEDINN